MALPKLTTPTYELEIPSTDEKISYRPFLVKEEKILLMAMESGKNEDIVNAVGQIVSECTFNKLKVKSMPIFDIEYIFLNIRAVSVGEIVEINVTCRDDEETNVRYNLNLTDVKVTFPKGHSNKVMLTDTTVVIMKYPSFNRFVENQFQQKDVDDDTVLDIIAESIDQIFQGEEVFDSSTTTPK